MQLVQDGAGVALPTIVEQLDPSALDMLTAAAYSRAIADTKLTFDEAACLMFTCDIKDAQWNQIAAALNAKMPGNSKYAGGIIPTMPTMKCRYALPRSPRQLAWLVRMHDGPARCHG